MINEADETPHRLLVIDDDPLIHRLVQIHLKPDPILVQCVSSGEEGLEAVQNDHPNVILLDQHMPGINGSQVLDWLNERSEFADIPVIMISSTHDTSAIVQCFDLGAMDYVTKPFNPLELRARVRSAIRMDSLVKKLADQALVDQLTGLWNRAFFVQRLEEEIKVAQRNHTPLSLIFCDLDKFKNLNDTRGHQFGDWVLQKFGEILSSGRASDIACRYGGEEFVIILPNTDCPEAELVAERYRERIRAEVWDEYSFEKLMVTASFGVADLDLIKEPTMDALISAADMALYEAKGSGRDRVVAAHLMDDSNARESA